MSCKLTKASFIQPFYTSVVVGDGKYDDVPTGDLSNTDCKVGLCWKQINKANKTITTINREEKSRRQQMPGVAQDENISEERENKFQLYIESQWQLPTDCIYCFPGNDEARREIPLVATDKAQVTPELIFTPPTWYAPVENCWTIASLDFNKQLPKPSFLHIGHYPRRNKHYRYYFRYPELIASQRGIIEGRWVKTVKDLVVEQIKNEMDGNISPRVLIVAPNKRENGEFIHIINDCVFDGDADILEFDVEGDCVSNFSMFSKTLLDSVDLVFYVDNLMATAQTFLSIVRTFQNLDSKKNISGIFCLINMMNPDCFYSVDQIMHGNMYFFLQLDVPPVSTRQGATPIEEMCPLCKNLCLYTDLMKQSVLDVMRAYYQLREIPTYQKTDEGEYSKFLVTSQKYPFRNEYIELLIHDLLNKVFTAPRNGEFKYVEPFSVQIRLALSSKQSYAWSDDGLPIAGFRENQNSSDICFTFNSFVENFRLFARANKYDFIANATVLDDLTLKANLIKVLSAHPFKNHRGIYIAVFYWVLNEIVDLCDSLESKPGSSWVAEFSHYISLVNDTKTDANVFRRFDPLFNYVRLLVKYGANLRIAFLTSKRFIRALQIIDNCMIVREWRSEKSQYSQNQQTVREFRMFCAAHILRSVNNIESRSIRLEENVRWLLADSINDTRLLELILHENTILIRMFKNKIQNLQGSAKERIETLSMIREHDSILQNIHRLILQGDSTEELVESFADLVVFLTEKKDPIGGDQFENLAKKLTMRIGKVLGYGLTNAKLFGAFFVYRLYDGSGIMVSPPNCFRVMCKTGDNLTEVNPRL